MATFISNLPGPHSFKLLRLKQCKFLLRGLHFSHVFFAEIFDRGVYKCTTLRKMYFKRALLIHYHLKTILRSILYNCDCDSSIVFIGFRLTSKKMIFLPSGYKIGF